MTRITKPVTRESESLDRRRLLIVTLHPTYLEIRPKGTRQRHTISYEACLWAAIKREIEDRKREKTARKSPRKR